MVFNFGKKLWFLYLLLCFYLVLLLSLSSSWLTTIPKRHYGKPRRGWVHPNTYTFGDPVQLLVNKAVPEKSLIGEKNVGRPYSYHDLPFICPPSQSMKPVHKSLKELFNGEYNEESDYHLKFGIDNDCEALCLRKTRSEGIRKAIELIEKDYIATWYIDEDLPAATTYISSATKQKKYFEGFSLGWKDPETNKYYLNNHFMLVIRYNAIDEDQFNIVGFEVYPKSITNLECPGAARGYEHYELNELENDEEFSLIPFSYSVYWREDFEFDWRSRWSLFVKPNDIDLDMEDPLVKYGFITNFTNWLLPFSSTTVLIILIFSVSLLLNDNFTFHLKLNSNMKTIREWVTTANRLNKTWQNVLLNIIVSAGIQNLIILIAVLTLESSLWKLHDISNIVMFHVIVWLAISLLIGSFAGTWLRMYLFQKKMTPKYDHRMAIICGSILPALTLFGIVIFNTIVWFIENNKKYPFERLTIFVSVYLVFCIPMSLAGGLLAVKAHLIYLSASFERSHSRGRAYSYTDPNNFKVENNQSNAKQNILNGDDYVIDFEESDDKKKKVKLKMKLWRRKSLYKRMLSKFSISDIGYLMLRNFITNVLPFHIMKNQVILYHQNYWLKNCTFFNYYGYLLTQFVITVAIVSLTSVLGCYLYILQSSRNKNNMLNENWRWKCFIMGSNIFFILEYNSLLYILNELYLRSGTILVLAIGYSLIFNIMLSLTVGSISYMSSLWFIINKFKSQL